MAENENAQIKIWQIFLLSLAFVVSAGGTLFALLGVILYGFPLLGATPQDYSEGGVGAIIFGAAFIVSVVSLIFGVWNVSIVLKYTDFLSGAWKIYLRNSLLALGGLLILQLIIRASFDV